MGSIFFWGQLINGYTGTESVTPGVKVLSRPKIFKKKLKLFVTGCNESSPIYDIMLTLNVTSVTEAATRGVL